MVAVTECHDEKEEEMLTPVKGIIVMKRWLIHKSFFSGSRDHK
jgi:hypothetical protein